MSAPTDPPNWFMAICGVLVVVFVIGVACVIGAIFYRIVQAIL